jgi:two-component system, OmpR family, phosphate regulon response regulator PhoB
MTAHILFVEDEPPIQELIRYTLEQAGMRAVGAADAGEALAALREELPDVMLVDWMLPDKSGLVLARELREASRTADLPIIMLTARGEEADRVKGLEQGADDYIVKPFSPRELIARIQAVLRRRAPHASDSDLIVGTLMAHHDRVYTQTQMLDQVWGDHVFIEERTVDVHVRRLRLVLGDEAERWVKTVRGTGYKFVGK